MFHLFAHSLLVLADGVTIQIGSNTYTISSDLIVYLFVAALIGLLAEFIVGWRLPFGFIGAIIAALIGIWLVTHIVTINGIGDIYIGTVPVLRALIGSMIFVALWHVLTYRTWRHRHRRRYSRRYE